MRGRVRAARPAGPTFTVEVELGDRTIEVRWEWDLDGPEPGEEIDLAARPETLRFFPAHEVNAATDVTVDTPAEGVSEVAAGER